MPLQKSTKKCHSLITQYSLSSIFNVSPSSAAMSFLNGDKYLAVERSEFLHYQPWLFPSTPTDKSYQKFIFQQMICCQIKCTDLCIHCGTQALFTLITNILVHPLTQASTVDSPCLQTWEPNTGKQASFHVAYSKVIDVKICNC